MRKSLITLALILFGAISAHAQGERDEISQLRTQIKELKDMVGQLATTVKSQGAELIKLRNENGKSNQQHLLPANDAGETSSQSINQVPAASGGGVVAPFIPDIGVVADIVGTSTQDKDDQEGNDRLSVRELELVFGHDIDPYSRFDSVITFSDSEDPAIEEAYVSYWGLPLDLKGRIGRFRPKIGKASATHRDVLDTVDEPLVIQRYFGAEGLYRTGLDVTGFTPISGDSFTQQLTLGTMEGGVGDGGTIFGEARRIPTSYLHLANSFDISELSNAELGGTYMLGSKNEDSTYNVNVFGVDSTLSYFVTPRNKLKFQNEFYFQHRSPGISDLSSTVTDIESSSPWGFYSLLDYRFAERWGGGMRYDYVMPIDSPVGLPRVDDSAVSGYLSFFQSEFARLRFQYEHQWLTEGTTDNRFFLQGTFAIGTHKHALQ